jgi:hypothetical protein
VITGSTYRFNWYDGLDVTISITYDGQMTWTPIVENHTTEIDLETEGQQECFYDWTVFHPESEGYYHNDEVYYKILDNNTGEEEIKGPIIIEDEPQLTTIRVFPSFTRVEYLKTKQFTAVGYDQIGRALDTQPEWSVNAGVTATINQQGLLTAGEVEEEVTVTATVGEISGTATVTVLERIGSARNKSNLHISIAITT